MINTVRNVFKPSVLQELDQKGKLDLELPNNQEEE